ncbi:MAG: type II secretion system F family protein [Candidatus Pacebacteria bacterium]|nr:type II secretion system F family protein [Candidatus Paceibacterota bacterium]
MLFKYTVITQAGVEQDGTIDAVSEDSAITTLQRNGYVITQIKSADKKSGFGGNITLFEHVSQKEIVILSRQMATLFEAQVSALRIFKLLGNESENPIIKRTLLKVADDIQGGLAVSKALAKHPDVFSSFYCNMVLAGEETGRLSDTFEHLAQYIDRTYTVTSKAQHALVYPAFIIATFAAVMVLMLTFVIPKLTEMIITSGVEIPFYTKIVIAVSNMFKNYGLLVFIGLAGCIVGGWQYAKTASGRSYVDSLKVSLPAIGNLYRKLYLARIADNLSTMLESGISMVQAIEITAAVVENVHYEEALVQVRDDIKNGASISQAFSSHPQIPTIMLQMIRVGEETGELSNILKTLARFYNREVEQAVDTVLGLIEPIMIIMLAVGVGGLLASVLMPIYSISMAIT